MTFRPLTDAQWSAMETLLCLPRTGRPYNDIRATVDGIRWRLETQKPWREVPTKYGKWNSLYRVWNRNRTKAAFRAALAK